LLSRRQFLSLIASGVAAETLLPFTDPVLHAELQDAEVHLRKRYTQPNRSYGSGSFGEWIADPQGLPCYRYTCNQLDDSAAVTPVETAWRDPTDQTHQIGNDRIVAAASNYGYVQVRQDEGGPKFLNDYKPEGNLFGAGIGYLADGNEVLATYYPGTGKSFDRFFGMGYLRKQTTGVNFSVDQTIFAPFGDPFGDDPVLISEVVITSQSPTTANLHWFEYWGCQGYPLSWDAFAAGSGTGNASAGRGSPVDAEEVNSLRRDFAGRLGHSFGKIAGNAKSSAIGLIQTSHLLPQKQQKFTTAVQEEDAAELTGDFTSGSAVNPEQTPAPANAPADYAVPPTTFLASLSDGPVRMLTNAAAFFGQTGVKGDQAAAGPDTMLVPDRVLRPAGLAGIVPGQGVPQPIAPDDLTASGPESALILDKPFILDAGQSQTLRFIYGYVPEGFSAADLIAKYRAQATDLFAKTSAAWKDEGVRLTVESDPWIERETHWHSYYLRSGFTYDDAFKEHILSQGAVYQYCMGYQGEARDPLQHALPLIFGESDLAKQVLRYTLKSQAADGALPFAMTGHGQPMSSAPQPSDFDLWLLWLASEYVLGTRDTAFLEEKFAAAPFRANAAPHSAKELLTHSYRHLVDTIGTGKHGLLRGLSGDWNAQLYYRGIHENLGDEIHRQSESMMNAAMAAYILDRYAAMLRYTGDAAAAQDAANRADQQRQAVRGQWVAKWFKRVWLGQTTGWLGEDRMWLDGQPWAILGQCATGEQRKALVKSIDELLRKPSRIGAKQVSEKLDWPGVVPGETTNGGIYDTLTGPLIWALAGIDGAMAWDEWKKNSRANHADVYRDIWYGIWSGPDVFCSSDSDHAGQTGYDWGLADLDAQRRPSSYRGLSWTAWPVMNMHRHAWPLYSASKLLGIEFTETGLDLAPVIPKPAYSFRSKLAGVEKTGQGYQGWYAPQNPGTWTIRLKLPASETSFQTLTIHDSTGESTPPITQADGAIQFQGNSTADHPLKWFLTKA
jgi:hypothetical protein